MLPASLGSISMRSEKLPGISDVSGGRKKGGGWHRNLSRFFLVALCLAPLRFMELRAESA